MGIVFCIGRISRHLEGKHVGEFGGEINRIQVSEGIFDGNKERVWRWR